MSQQESTLFADTVNQSEQAENPTPVGTPVPAETSSDDAKPRMVCPKCKGTGTVKFLNFAGHEMSGKCFRCAHDRNSEAKGYLDQHDLERNRAYDIDPQNTGKPVNHRFTFTIRAKVDGQDRTTHRKFAACTEIFTRTGMVMPKDIRQGDVILTPRLKRADTTERYEAVGLLEAEVIEVKEVAAAIPF